MKELSLSLLDIAENSVAAGASLIEILLKSEENFLVISVKDNGHGIKNDELERAADPFFTKKAGKCVGMGLSLLKEAALLAGGDFSLTSRTGSEAMTEAVASFDTENIDFRGVGDIPSTLMALITANYDVDFVFSDTSFGKKVELDTREMKKILGNARLLTDIKVIEWLKAYLSESYEPKNN